MIPQILQRPIRPRLNYEELFLDLMLHHVQELAIRSRRELEQLAQRVHGIISHGVVVEQRAVLTGQEIGALGAVARWDAGIAGRIVAAECDFGLVLDHWTAEPAGVGEIET